MIAIIYISINQSNESIAPKFCDQNYIDAVLWDGIRYRVTRDEWIATYDDMTGTVGPFVDKDECDFRKGSL